MAGTYSGAVVKDGDHGNDGLVDDTSLKWFGVRLSNLLVPVVSAFVAYTATTQVDFALMWTILPQLVNVYLLVLQIVIIDGILSVITGVLVGLTRVSKTAITNDIATVHVQFFRGTPPLFQIFVIHLGTPTLWPKTFPIQNRGLPAAIIVLTLNRATYVDEMAYGGIGAVPDGQVEVIRPLDMGYIQGTREVIVPQVWRNVLAVTGDDQVIFMRDTSLFVIITTPELMQAFRSVNSATSNSWTPLALVAIVYPSIASSLTRLATYLEERSGWGGSRR